MAFRLYFTRNTEGRRSGGQKPHLRQASLRSIEEFAKQIKCDRLMDVFIFDGPRKSRRLAADHNVA